MNRKYDTEFKREAVRLVLEEGLRVREVERNLGITHGVLKDWVQIKPTKCGIAALVLPPKLWR